MKKWSIVLLCGLLLTGCGGVDGSECYEQGTECLLQADYEQAALLFTQAVESGERLSESYRGLGIAQLEQGDNAAAIAAFSRSLNEMEGSNLEFETDVMYYLAEARKDYGEYEKAAEVYTEILKLEEDPKAYYLRGSIYLDLEEYDKAAADFDLALSESRDYDMYINICHLYWAKEMNMEGEAYLVKALEIEPKEAADYSARGRVCYEMKDYEGAKQELMQALEGDDPEAILMLGKVYLAMEDVASARSMYQEYLNGNDNKAKAYNGLAMCDIFEKNYDSALDNIAKGLECNDPAEDQHLRFNEIVVYEYKLDFATANTKMDEYLLLYPDDKEALREKEFLVTR